MIPFLIVSSIFGGFFYLIIHFGNQQRKKNTQYFEEFAKINGLSVHFEDDDKKRHFPILSGRVGGKDFKMYLREDRSSDNTYIYTTMEVTCDNRKRVAFTLSQVHVVTGLSKKMGFGDFEIGDKYFDDRFKIKARKSDLPLDFFTESIKSELLMLRPKMIGRFHIKKDIVKYEAADLIRNDEILARLHKISSILVDMAERVEQY